jgi:hypothetical protein
LLPFTLELLFTCEVPKKLQTVLYGHETCCHSESRTWIEGLNKGLAWDRLVELQKDKHRETGENYVTHSFTAWARPFKKCH